MLFLDGVGLGPDDPDTNPFAHAATPALDALTGARWTDALAPAVVVAGGRAVGSLDALFGHAALPQSATGQTALLTGHDAVAAMGHPYGPWPGPTLERLLAADGIFHDARRAGGAALANAYPPRFLEAIGAPDEPPAGRRRWRPPATIVAARAAGVRLRGDAEARRGAAVRADLGFSGHPDPTADDGVGRHAAATAAWARTLVGVARDHALTYLDVWVTDRVGHRADLRLASALVVRIDAVLDALASSLGDVTLVVVSDHGNLEDAAAPRHTRGRVPLLVHGPAASAFARARDLRDVRPALRRAWGVADAPD